MHRDQYTSDNEFGKNSGKAVWLSGKTFPTEVPRVIRLPKGPPAGNFFQTNLRVLHLLSDFGFQKPKSMQLRACLRKNQGEASGSP